MTHSSAIIATMSGAVLVAALLPARATINSESISENAAQACQLSLPTIDTQASPRATGFRNDGTAGLFVICGTSLPTDDSLLSGAALWLYSTSTQSVTVNCTFTSGTANSGFIYKSKSLVLPAGGDADRIYVWSGDYGGGAITGGLNVTITCALPPKVSILRTESTYDLNIGA